MSRFVLAGGFIALILAGGPAAAQEAMHRIADATELTWTAGPPGLPAGSKATVVHGDPAKPGTFVLRAWMPKGYKVAPHTHPSFEAVTVLSGAMRFGVGPSGDPATAKKLGPGGFAGLDAGVVHYVVADEDSIIQINSTGPFAINYVNPADDPRTRK
jgi:quercetin dioxygenase-like cupin family protein